MTENVCVFCKKPVVGREFASIEVWESGGLKEYRYICKDCLPPSLEEMLKK